MKSAIKILQLLLITFFLGSSAFSQDQKPAYKSNQIYEFFNQFSPKDIVDYTNLAALHFSRFSDKLSKLSKDDEEVLANQLLKEFQNNSKLFNSIDTPLHPFVVLLRCDQFRIVAHPIREFFAVMSQLNFIKIYKDVNGKKIGVELCEKVVENKSGVWGFQNQWWPLTDKPLVMGVFTMNVPNSIYQVQSYYPTVKYSETQLNALME